MPPANLTTTLSFDSANPLECPFNPDGEFSLEQGQSLVITLSGFPTGSTLGSLVLQNQANPAIEFIFPAQLSHPNPSVFVVHASPSHLPPPTENLVITITDNQDPPTDQTYSLNVNGTIGGSSEPWHSADPEVINKAGGGQGDES